MRRSALTLLLLMLGAAAPATADEAEPVLDQVSAPSSIAEGTPRIAVSGRMTVAAQPEVLLWSDGTFTASNEYAFDPDIDLVEGRVQHAIPSDPIVFSWKVAPSLPGTSSDVKPNTQLRWGFQLGGHRYYVSFWNEAYPNITQGRYTSWIYDCAGTVCTSWRPLSGATFDPATRTARVRVPLTELATSQPNGVLAQGTMSQLPPGYDTASGAWYCNANCGFPSNITWDGVASIAPYELPVASVFAGVSAPDAIAEEVAFSPLGVTVAPGSLEVPFGGDLKLGYRAPGEYRLWLKACFGPCTVQSSTLVVT